MKSRILSVDELRLDGDTQARVKIHEETVEDYTEKIQDADGDWPLGELDVFHDGSDYFVADGFHRTLAALRAKRGSVPCRIHKGTAIDAKIFGMTANDRHGLRMSRADKRGCVEWLLDNGGKLTQVEVAQKAGVTRQTVAKIIADRKPADVKFNIPKTTEGPVKPYSAAPESAGASETEPGNDGGREGDAVVAETGKAAAASPDNDWKMARSKAKKTAEALQRAIGDLNDVRKFAYMPTALDDIREIIVALDAMK